MNLQTYLNAHNITKYHLAQISGIPKTTIMDICAGRSEIGRCSARTIQQLAAALGCTMEDVMTFSSPHDNRATSLIDGSYLECGLPSMLKKSIEKMRQVWAMLDRGETYLRWDCDYCNLQTDINNAEMNGIISTEQAWYLREKYLRMERM